MGAFACVVAAVLGVSVVRRGRAARRAVPPITEPVAEAVLEVVEAAR
jgi:hypothetical protein